jgi:hypothetical protein
VNGMSIRHDRDMRYRKSRNKTITRPKTFKTEEAAKKYAEANGVKKYTLENIKSIDSNSKKIRIVIERD